MGYFATCLTNEWVVHKTFSTPIMFPTKDKLSFFANQLYSMNFRKSTHIKAFFIFCSAALICTNLFGQHLSVNVSEEGVQIREDGKNVLFYQIRSKSMAGKYARAGYIHPLYGLNGEVLTCLLYTSPSPRDRQK